MIFLVASWLARQQGEYLRAENRVLRGRWYREKVAAKYDGSRARPAAGRPRSPDDRVGQLLTMARENPSWGYTRLRGALMNLGLDLGRSTIARILKANGIEPAPLRGKTMP